MLKPPGFLSDTPRRDGSPSQEEDGKDLKLGAGWEAASNPLGMELSTENDPSRGKSYENKTT